MSRARILVVEDDPAILAGLREKLRMEGHDVVAVEDGRAALRALADGPFDLVVLDLMLPEIDGLSVLRRLRRRSAALPVLILSAKGREEEKVEGLRAGADDYLAKPFGLKELVARIDALLRRARGAARTLTFGDVRIDLERRKVLVKGREAVLSRKELDVLLYLARNEGRAVTRAEVLAAVWGHFASSADRAVDYHILNLRRKLEPDPESPRHIVTRYGEGYELVV